MIDFDVVYNKLDSPSLLPFLESAQLVEVTAGKASTLSLSLCNADGRFTGSWQATRGDSIALRIPPAGLMTFAIRKISVQASPRVVTWEAEARPSVSKSPSGRGSGSPPPKEGAIVSDKKSWNDGPLKNKTLKEIAQRVCSECGLTLKYCAKDNPSIEYVARYEETGFHLLTRLGRRWGLCVRASAGTLSIIGAQRSGDASPPVSIAFPVDKIISLQKVDDVKAAAVKSARLDPRKAADVQYSAGDGEGTDEDLDFDAEGAVQIYDASVASGQAAQMQIVPTAGIVAGSVLNISGYGLREVTEMRYTRTGDTETMVILTRAAE
jgi:phage protein D